MDKYGIDPKYILLIVVLYKKYFNPFLSYILLFKNIINIDKYLKNSINV